ncbi:glycoside hydrolase family 20 zincin-like fold domain-containing protein [Paenibacillus sp.]|uniref:glycoside hydrolase family 20 zincin-like fold domain-containing protein n=1 Tax=Paenibacillus sp. TaxID=58172 RepID=UPI002810F8C5|nr:glycoside hydrolase family 20 zincin-like fold domain-containing protein [Paenibacillus sp.]
MFADFHALTSRLLPTPKSISPLSGGGFDGGHAISFYADASLSCIADVVRVELANVGFGRVERADRPRQGGLSLLGRESIPDEVRTELEALPFPGQAYRLRVAGQEILLYALEPQGALNGLATLVQLFDAAAGQPIPALESTDGPDIERRIVSPTMTWYAGFARVGFGMQLWDEHGWQSFIDWCFRHKINALNIVMYGFWPFEFPEYSETVLRDVKMKTWSAEIDNWVEVSYTHPNLRKPFLTDMIRYANARGIEIYAYIGMNSYSGGYPVVYPESRSVLSPELIEAGHVNNYDSMCTSRPDVRDYLIASVKRIESLGFNGLVFEESEEVQWFCRCAECQRKYGDLPPNDAKHSVTVDMLHAYLDVLKPETLVGVRWLREPPIVKDRAYLERWKERLPERVVLFWAPGLEDDDREFLKWVDVYGPARVWSRNCEGSGFAASLGRIPYLIPDTFPDTLKNYAFQHLWNDILQFQGAVNTSCAAINGYGFEWYGHELFFMATAQYGWDCWRLDNAAFLAHAARHLHGDKNGPIYENVIRTIPCIHETQICPELPSFPFMPNKYTGEEGVRYLEHSAEAAEQAVRAIETMLSSEGLNRLQRDNLRATRVMALRMREVALAGLFYNRYVEAAKRPNPDATELRRHALAALRHAEEDERLIKEHYFDTQSHDWTGVAIGEYYISSVINEYKKTFAETLGPRYAPDPTMPRIVGGESLPWEWLLEWGPKIAAAKPLAIVRSGGEAAR